ncbi:MAG: helicase C-terminal domain-containing protein [Candidatus Izemoplasmatales bacterium]|nr:helicase C-terminal domain-containing protein [Candidatus Izemoplasmatales bacterium]
MYNNSGDIVKNIHVSAKEIAEFLYGSGNITSDRALTILGDEGTAIHQYWQGLYLKDDQKEVLVKTTIIKDDFHLEITGRIDGIVYRNDVLVLEEIKSTHRDLDEIDEKTTPAHLAQAKLYAYMYVFEHSLTSIMVQLTYIHVDDKQVKAILKKYTRKSLEKYFIKVTDEFLKWERKIAFHEESRLKSITGLTFPFSQYRINQRELMGHVYRTVLDRDILYAIAPTGIGKTIATIFPVLKAINNPAEKVFYLTAKNDGKQIALDTISLLESHGLIAKTCEITAKDSMCFLKERDCDPEVCKYAKGYYNRVYKAIDDLYEHESIMRKDIIRTYARKHRVCPFELSLDISNYADMIIADYNYAFDPRVHLIRYFDDDRYKPILLVDEAHNLISRGRDMYSATVSESELIKLLELAKPLKPSPSRDIKRLLEIFTEYQINMIDVDFVKKESINDFLIQTFKRVLFKLDRIMMEGSKKIPNKNAIFLIYFDLVQFIKISEFFDGRFVFTMERTEDHDFQLSIRCLDASKYLLSTIKDHTEACVFFSATLDPIHYYKQLLTANVGKDIKLDSAFMQRHLLLNAVDAVSTRYADRKDSIAQIIEITKVLVTGKRGNYILFFPSYQYLNMVRERLDVDLEKYEIIVQKKDMNFRERHETIEMFKTASDKTQIGMFVMGGVFGESIDLIGDMLSGVLIVGVGLPALSPINNLLKSYFDDEFNSGFDFAYTYPGINKVIQAVGRVIRSETDRGVAILIDDRFTSRKYLSIYPKEWSHLRIINDPKNLKKVIRDFWKAEEVTEEIYVKTDS